MTLQKRKSKSSRSSQRLKRKRGSTKKGRQTRAEEVALAEVKDDLSQISAARGRRRDRDHAAWSTRRHLIGFASDDDWFDIGWSITRSFCVESRTPVLRSGKVEAFR